MQKPLKITLLALGFVAAGLGSVAAAEGEATPEATTPAAAVPPETTLSGQEMLTRAKAAMSSIESAAAVISRMLRDARNEKDVVKVLCLDDKLNQIDVAKRSVSERVEAMGAALSSGNADRVEFDFAVVGALEERANSLSAEANQCIGEEKGFVGGAKLEVKVDPDIPVQDTSTPPTTVIVSTPPTAASPVF
jgi:hypothetical protein